MAVTVPAVPSAGDLAAFVGVDPGLLEKARAHLTTGRSVLLVVSGKLASGKDTVAPAALDRLGYTDAEHLYYALPLKEELDAIIADMREWFFTLRPGSMTQRRRHQLAEVLATRHAMPVEHAALFVGRLLDQVRMNLLVHSRSRTDIMRTALQKLGTDVRRAQDENYWVKKALKPAVETLAEGRSVYFTDARFPNEVDVAALLGAFAVRLDITPETQLARLLARDGLSVPSEETLTHKSETSLDDYPGFDVRVDNGGALEATLDLIEQAWGVRALSA